MAENRTRNATPMLSIKSLKAFLRFSRKKNSFICMFHLLLLLHMCAHEHIKSNNHCNEMTLRKFRTQAHMIIRKEFKR